MKDLESKLNEAAFGALSVGESVVAGTRCEAPGAAHHARGADEDADNPVAGPPLPESLAVGLTDHHLLVFAVGGFGDAPKHVERGVPLAHVAGVRANRGQSVGLTKTRLEIEFVDGSAWELHIPLEDRKVAERFGDALVAATRLLEVEIEP